MSTSAQRPVAGDPRIHESVPFGARTGEDGGRFQSATGDGEWLRLDRTNQCLWKGVGNAPAQRLSLAPKTLAVLQHLIDRAGRLVKLEEFLEVVWPGVCVQPEVLKNQILSLRTLLKDSARKPRFIETLPRRGYRFIARLSTDREAARGSAHDASTSIRLVGRDEPMSDLHASLQRTLHQRQREMVFVTGECGIGKTSLVEEFLQQVRRQMPDARVALGQCVEGYGGKEAYYPMLEALREMCTSRGGEQLVRELTLYAPGWLGQIPGLSPPIQRLSPQPEPLGGTRGRMPRELMGLLERLSHDAPVVLVLEDLQWADPSTVSLIEVLARARTPMQVLLIGTYRPADLSSGGHPLRALRQELQLHGLCRELPLQPLSQTEIEAYLTAQAPGANSPPATLADLIHRRTEGNPLFLITLLEHLRQRGRLANIEGSWQLHAPIDAIEFEVPETLREMIDARLARLSADEQHLLDVASVMGLEFSPRWCAEAAGLDAERAEELCHTLAERHCVLLRSQPGAASLPRGEESRYEFVHAMYREVLYQRQPPARRAGLRVKLARWLEPELPAGHPPLSSRLAHLLGRSDGPERARSHNGTQRSEPKADAASHPDHAAD